MDNGQVFCVSTGHWSGKKIKRLHKKQRIILQDNGHLKEIWGNKGAVEISIPTLIDDYNGGVGVTNSYHHKNLFKKSCVGRYIIKCVFQ